MEAEHAADREPVSPHHEGTSLSSSSTRREIETNQAFTTIISSQDSQFTIWHVPLFYCFFFLI